MIHEKLEYINLSALDIYMTCHRKYFWWEILRMEPKKLSINLLIGKLIHLALQLEGENKNTNFILKQLENEFKKETKSSFTKDISQNQLEYILELIKIIYKAYHSYYLKHDLNWKVVQTELSLRWKLKKIDVYLAGTLDALFNHIQYKPKKIKDLWIGETKTTTQINSQYISRLDVDLQIQLYSILLSNLYEKPKGVLYNIIRKPSIYQKKKETFDDFLIRIENEYKYKPESYFYRKPILFSNNRIDAALKDILLVTSELKTYYECMTENEFINPSNWYRNTKSCFLYNIPCQYFVLCRYKYIKPYLLLFKEREKDSYEKIFGE